MWWEIVQNPLVVGYKGEIGSFILQGLLRAMPKASNIWCYDVNDSEKEKIERLKKADLVFLCVPIEKTESFFTTYGQYLEDKTVIEQTSQKSYFYNNRKIKAVLKQYNIHIFSMHILFRPSATPNPNDRRVALINRAQWVNSHISEVMEIITQARRFYYEDYKHHDLEMAMQQMLVHKVLLTLDKFLVGDNLTYISQQVKILANRIKVINPILYNIIQSSPNKNQVLKDFYKLMKETKHGTRTSTKNQTNRNRRRTKRKSSTESTHRNMRLRSRS